jgi:DNA-binding HxlR family transcriptional regulator
MALNHDFNGPQISYLPQPALERIAKMNLFDTSCAGHQVLECIANKWTILIVYVLTQGKKRYGELKQQVVGISPKMLIQNLRQLERYGLIEREVHPSVPPKVEYSLTPLGASLIEPLAILGEWAYQHIADVKTATEHYDSNPNDNDYWEPK